MGLRSSIPLSAATLAWSESLCGLLERQLRIETGGDQPVSEYLFGALLERLLAEMGEPAPERADRAEALDRRFRRLVFEHAITEHAVGFYAAKLNVSENSRLRCVRSCSGRSPAG